MSYVEKEVERACSLEDLSSQWDTFSETLNVRMEGCLRGYVDAKLQNAISQAEDDTSRSNAVNLVSALSKDASIANLRSSLDLKVDDRKFHSVVRQLLVRMDLLGE
uniref:Uncharacterized protein n=1 Tax=Hemiselmis andersenii TaxID=464988 RepID=A0A7S1HB48_HEMAN